MTTNDNGKSGYVPLRIPREMLAAIEDQVAKSVTHAKDEPYNVSSWIRAAIQEKLDHLARSRRKPAYRNSDQKLLDRLKTAGAFNAADTVAP